MRVGRVQGLGCRVQGSGFRVGAEAADPGPARWVHPSPSTLNPRPSTLNPQPSTFNPHPSTPNPQPSTFNPHPSTPNPQPSTLNPASTDTRARDCLPRLLTSPRILCYWSVPVASTSTGYISSQAAHDLFVRIPLSSEYGMCKTVQARFRPWLSGSSPYNFLRCSLFAQKRCRASWFIHP